MLRNRFIVSISTCDNKETVNHRILKYLKTQKMEDEMRRSSMKMDVSHGVLKDLLYTVMSLMLILFVSEISEHAAYAQNSANAQSKVIIKDGDEWNYFKGIQKPPREWKSNGFDHSHWQKGLSGLGYGIGSNITNLGDMQGNYSTVYARKEFAVNNPGVITGMALSVVCDGPFIAYINGIEVIRTNTVQQQPISIRDAESYDISGFAHELFPKNNVLAVECNNDDITSKDFSFISILEVVENEEGRQ